MKISPLLAAVTTSIVVISPSIAIANDILLGLRSRGNSELHTLDLNNGQAALVGVTGIFTADGLAANIRRGTVWALGNDELFSVNTTTGAADSIAELSGNFRGGGLAHDPDSNLLYASDPTNRNLYSISPSTGVNSLIGPTAEILGLAYDSERNILYGVTPNSLVVVDTSNGSAQIVGPLGLEISIGGSGLAFNPRLNSLYLSSRNLSDLHTVNTQTGLANSLGSIGENAFHGLAFIPEASEDEFVKLQIISPDQGVELSFSSTVGFSYQLQYSTNLQTESWMNLGDAKAGTGDEMVISDAISVQRRFYRMRRRSQ